MGERYGKKERKEVQANEHGKYLTASKARAFFSVEMGDGGFDNYLAEQPLEADRCAEPPVARKQSGAGSQGKAEIRDQKERKESSQRFGMDCDQK